MNTLKDADGWRWYSEIDQINPQSYVSVTTVIEYGAPTPPKLKNWLKNNSANKINKTLEATSSHGTAVHDMIENQFNGVESSKLNDVSQEFKKWQQKVGARALHLETPVYSNKYGFAGRPDFIGEIEGKIVIADWKTSNIYKKEPWMEQLGAYRLAAIEMGLVDDNCGLVCLMIPRDDPKKIKHFTYQHYEFCEDAFLTSLAKLKQHHFYKLKAMKWKWLEHKTMIRG